MATDQPDQNKQNSNFDDIIDSAERELGSPDSANMQWLQAAVAKDFDGLRDPYAPAAAASKALPPASIPSGFTGLPPAFSGLGLLSATAASDLATGGVLVQAASAAPAAMGKGVVGQSATFNGLGPAALANMMPAERLADALPLLKPALSNANVPASAEFAQLMAMITDPDMVALSNDALANLVASMGQGLTAENLELAIDAVLDQLSVLNNTFDPLYQNLSGDVRTEMLNLQQLGSGDLGFAISEDAAGLSGALGDLLGGSGNFGLSSLLDPGATLDEVISLIGPLPDLDASPVLDPVLDVIGDITSPIGDIVSDITDPIGGVLDPVLDPIGGVIGDITDPIGEVLDPVLDPILDPIGEVLDPIVDPIGGIIGDITDPIGEVLDPITDPIGEVLDPITDPIGGILDPITDGLPDLGLGGLLGGVNLLSTSGSENNDGSLLDSSSSGISSTAGDGGSGLLGGVLGALDPNKG